VETGKVRAVEVNGSVAVAEEDVSTASASSLPTYISIPEAINQYDLEREILTRLVEAGRVRAIKIDGSLVVAVEDVRRIAEKVIRKDELWARVRHLDGEPIAVGEARQKYHLGAASLNRWIDKGYVRVIKEQRGKGRGRKRNLNEADVAYAALVAEERGRRQGRRIFVPEFVPPHLVS
jgi:hypothetical protein